MAVFSNLPAKEFEDARKWSQYWLDPCKFMFGLCYTEDEVAAGSNEVAVVRLIPDLPHLRAMTKLWQEERLFVVVKSRRMIVSWSLTALELYLAMTTPHSRIYVISTDQMKSDKLVERHQFIYKRLPEDMPKPHISTRAGVKGGISRIDFEETDSSIEALPGDPDKMRQEGATLIRMEEIAFWKPAARADLTYKAIMPTIMGGGRLVVVSSAQDGTFFKRLVFDELGTAVRRG